MKKKSNSKIKNKSKKIAIKHKLVFRAWGRIKKIKVGHIKYMALKIGAALFALVFLIGFYFIAIQSSVRESSFYNVQYGSSISSVAGQLKNDSFINSQNLFKASILLMGGKIQSGQYEIVPGYSVWRIAKMMRGGDIASVSVVIPEGLTVKQIKNLLMEIPTLTGSVNCDKTVKSEEIKPVCNLKEGDLFPDTYRVARGTGRLDVLELSRKKMESIRVGWENSGRSMPAPLKSWTEVVTLASIIQKETPKDSEMPTVASVYLNRLRKKMKLQADPTVVYVITHGLGDMQGHGLFSTHLKIKSPYNTYMNYGLPPAPIANVGRSAIAAVLNPADTSYLFFVADGQGGHKFAKSYEEHIKNQASWREIKKALQAKK